MGESSDITFAVLLFAGLFLDWVRAAVSAAAAVLVRNSNASAIVAAVLGAIMGLVGSRLELLDVYFTRDGWEAIDILTALQVTMSALAGIAWWGIARAGYALARRLAGRT